MKILKGLFFAVFMALVSMSAYAEKAVEVGAAQVKEYVPLLKGKRVAILSNHTGMVGDKHTLDIMLVKLMLVNMYQVVLMLKLVFLSLRFTMVKALCQARKLWQNLTFSLSTFKM